MRGRGEPGKPMSMLDAVMSSVLLVIGAVPLVLCGGGLMWVDLDWVCDDYQQECQTPADWADGRHLENVYDRVGFGAVVAGLALLALIVRIWTKRNHDLWAEAMRQEKAQRETGR